MKRHGRAFALFVFLCAFALRAQADDRSEADRCASAAEAAQKLRASAKLGRARAEILVCAQTSCPEVVRSLCQRWLSEVEAAMPTIVIRASDPQGRDLSAVRVTMDGTLISTRLDGAAITVDPGRHRFVFESPRRRSIARELVIAQGEKNRLIVVELEPAEARAAAEPRREPPKASSSVGPYILGGAGVLALGVSAYLQLAAIDDYQSAKDDGCGTTRACPDERDRVERTLTAGRIVMAAGAVLVGAGVTWYLLEQRGTEPAVAVRARATESGGLVGLDARF